MCVPLQFRATLYTNEKSLPFAANGVVLVREQRATQLAPPLVYATPKVLYFIQSRGVQRGLEHRVRKGWVSSVYGVKYRDCNIFERAAG